ncbi:DUF3068 domain-containing protein [Streptomyces sp. NPDC059885]|uniref:DUF3068 domain-containing protein n=1 Tax=Streptomyces sp. NPDC059885 TaxID=3346988 RepID=UPI003659252F
MRRTASPMSLILLGAGVFLLVLAPLLVTYVQPHAKRTPVDVDTTTVFTGTGSYFDTSLLKTVHDRRITITRQVRGDVADSVRSGNAVWDVSTSVDTDATLPAADTRDSLQWTLERWVTDRRTNEPVHCCRESPAFDGEAYLKFPFDVEERGYRWWDGTLGGVVRLRYAGPGTVQGYEGLRFTGSVPPTRTGVRQVPGRLVGRPRTPQVLAEEWYANSRIELVADRRTGRIVYAAIGPRKTLRAPGSEKDAVVLLSSDKIAFTARTQRQQVELASADSRKLELLGSTAPLGPVRKVMAARVGGRRG